MKICCNSSIKLICAGKEATSDLSPWCPCHEKDITLSPVSTVSMPTFSCAGTLAPTSASAGFSFLLSHAPEYLASQISDLTLFLLPTNTLHISHAKDSGCLLIWSLAFHNFSDWWSTVVWKYQIANPRSKQRVCFRLPSHLSLHWIHPSYPPPCAQVCPWPVGCLPLSGWVGVELLRLIVSTQ